MPLIVLAHSPAHGSPMACFCMLTTSKAKTSARTYPHLTVALQKNRREQNETEHRGTLNINAVRDLIELVKKADI